MRVELIAPKVIHNCPWIGNHLIGGHFVAQLTVNRYLEVLSEFHRSLQCKFFVLRDVVFRGIIHKFNDLTHNYLWRLGWSSADHICPELIVRVV